MASFAPLVHLYKEEAAKPISAREFIAYSSLTMANYPCPSQETLAIGASRLRLKRDGVARAIDLQRLGGPRPYRIRARSADCRGHQRRAYATSQHTRPYDPGRAASLQPHEGFYLDLLIDRVPGTAAYRRNNRGQLEALGVPVYYDVRARQIDGRSGLRIDYWMLFGFNGYPGRSGATYALNSEGDWERVSVLLRRGDGRDRWEPVSVGYHVHGRHRDVMWSSVEVAAADNGGPPTHPVVYAAYGNHAPYPDVGETDVPHEIASGRTVRAPDRRLACTDCPRWSTWRRLLPAKREPWYGYGGAWGSVGSADSSSPIGPSPYTR